jgi:hypothetical protein
MTTRSTLDRRALLSRLPTLGALGAMAATTLARPRAASAQKLAKSSVGVLTVGQYLDRAALLLDENRRAQDWIGAHPYDPNLAAVALEVAQTRSEVATRLGVPPALKQPHLHMLLVLEGTASSFEATAAGDPKKAAQRMANTRTEEQTMLLAFDAAKVKLPTLR